MQLQTTSSRDRAQKARSPKQIQFTFQLRLPQAEAFDLVCFRLNEWFASVHSVKWDHSRSSAGSGTPGVCSERTCNFDGQDLVETIVEYDANRRYSYSVDFERSEMKMPLSGHLGVFEVAPHASGTTVTWTQYFRPHWFVPGALLRWQMRDKMMRPAILELIRKYGGELLSAD